MFPLNSDKKKHSAGEVMIIRAMVSVHSGLHIRNDYESLGGLKMSDRETRPVGKCLKI